MHGWQYHSRLITKHNVDRNSGRFDSEYYTNFGLSFNALGRVFFFVKPVASYT